MFEGLDVLLHARGLLALADAVEGVEAHAGRAVRHAELLLNLTSKQ